MDMKCDGCVTAVKNKFQTLEGLSPCNFSILLKYSFVYRLPLVYEDCLLLQELKTLRWTLIIKLLGFLDLSQ